LYILKHFLNKPLLFQGSDGTGGKYDEQCEIILNATDKLCNSMGNAAVMVKQARLLGQVRLAR